MQRLAQQANLLSVMGVQPWYARYRLSGAAVSPVFLASQTEESSTSSAPEVPSEFPAEAVAESAESHTKGRNRISLDAPTSARKISTLISSPSSETAHLEPEPQKLGRSGSGAVDSSAEHDAIASPMHKLSEEAVADLPDSLSLGLYRCGDVMALLGDSSATGWNQQLSLLDKVCSLLDEAPRHFTLVGTFNWPVFHKMPVAQRDTKEVLAQLLSRFMTSGGLQAGETLLLFGVGLEAAHVTALTGIDEASVTVRESSVSLSSCLLDSSNKSQLWAELLGESVDRPSL